MNLFLAELVIGFVSVQSSWINKLDQPAYKDCPGGQSVFKVRSEHHNHEEDRYWDIQCRGGGVNGACTWTGYLNNYDQMVSYQCPNGVISGFYSEHHNHYEDRQFKVKCCGVTGRLTNCYTTPYINNWDAYFDYVVPAGKYLAGIHSEHHNHYEDRRFKFTVCSVA